MRVLVAFSLAASLACHDRLTEPVTEVDGTWGGDDAGLIASDSAVHIHIGCTFGDAEGPIHPDVAGRFETTGIYNVDAHPIDLGIFHPARFSGRIVLQTMTLTVILTDTGRQLGPVTLVYGKEPRMGPCPICRNPELDR